MKVTVSRLAQARSRRVRIPQKKLDAFAEAVAPKNRAKAWNAAEFLRELRAK